MALAKRDNVLTYNNTASSAKDLTSSGANPKALDNALVGEMEIETRLPSKDGLLPLADTPVEPLEERRRCNVEGMFRALLLLLLLLLLFGRAMAPAPVPALANSSAKALTSTAVFSITTYSFSTDSSPDPDVFLDLKRLFKSWT
ncbi:hypothetical protein WICPIJ_008367 [Wickerhamomyces pijperi]|uniref:Uncharacterized protein n=1 Tax=Wickerhamomyces pijperi TaxID=599730 RepID=A0A9P8PZJ7_WICPI|nr:hypothetical protein WICPIJ_008367 [Wickerhamomyces pijperi]